jgi:Ca2+-binding EF-hand superfamily protein
MTILMKEGVRRFGKDFMEEQIRLCRSLFDQTNTSKDSDINYNEMFGMFERLFRKVGISNSEENLKIEDIKRLLELMDFHKKGAIGYEEFELFYVKGLLGS